MRSPFSSRAPQFGVPVRHRHRLHRTEHRAATDIRQSVRYQPHSPLRSELNRRVQAYFADTGRRPEGGPRMWVKTAVILAWFAASYALLVFVAGPWWQAVPLALSLSLAVAGIGFNIQHDGGHDAYARSRGGNLLSSWALDLVGASSYVWRFKHTIVHHHWTNVEGADEDIDAAPFMRLAPQQRRHAFHRVQHWYAWLLFGFLPAKWTFYDDFACLVRGRIGAQPIPFPRGVDLAVFVGGKLVFFGWVFAIPMLAGHSFGVVIAFYALCSAVTGVCLSVVFQAAHCVEEADFPVPPGGGGRMQRPWAEHQLATTVDFAPSNAVLTWFLGGLTHQIEHHLFPRISHVHYTALAPIVRATCAEYGVPYRSHARFRAAIASHVRHLKRLGRPVS
jgi:linoleoyl-CoA desaturase